MSYEPYPEIARSAVDKAQAIRDKQLGKNCYPAQSLSRANETLRQVLRRPQIEHFVIRPAERHPLVKHALAFTCFWYSGRLLFRDPNRQPLRSQVAKTVMFREFLLRYSAGQDYNTIMHAMCPSDIMHQYADSRCEDLDLGYSHFFLHSSLSARLLSEEEYQTIDGQRWATILYPMYEADIIAAIVGLIIALLKAYDYRNQRRSRSDRADEITVLHEHLALAKKDLKRARKFIRAIVSEMAIRERCLLELIKDVKGRISREELFALYLDRYLPTLDRFRESAETPDWGALGLSVDEILQATDALAPHFCQGTTKEKRQCQRVVPGGVDYCWQHRDENV